VLRVLQDVRSEHSLSCGCLTHELCDHTDRDAFGVVPADDTVEGVAPCGDEAHVCNLVGKEARILEPV